MSIRAASTERKCIKPHPPCSLEFGCPSPTRSGIAPCTGHAQTCSGDPSISRTIKRFKLINTVMKVTKHILLTTVVFVATQCTIKVKHLIWGLYLVIP